MTYLSSWSSYVVQRTYTVLWFWVWDHHHQNLCLGLAVNGSLWVPIKLHCYGPATEHIKE